MSQESRLDHVRIGSIVVRCHEFDRMFAFWQEALHYEVEHTDPNGGFVILRDPGGKGRNISLGLIALSWKIRTAIYSALSSYLNLSTASRRGVEPGVEAMRKVRA